MSTTDIQITAEDAAELRSLGNLCAWDVADTTDTFATYTAEEARVRADGLKACADLHEIAEAGGVEPARAHVLAGYLREGVARAQKTLREDRAGKGIEEDIEEGTRRVERIEALLERLVSHVSLAARCSNCGLPAVTVGTTGLCPECERESLAIDHFAAEAVVAVIESAVSAARGFASAEDLIRGAAEGAMSHDGESSTIGEIGRRLHALSIPRSDRHRAQIRAERAGRSLTLNEDEQEAVRESVFASLYKALPEYERPTGSLGLYVGELAASVERQHAIARLLVACERGEFDLATVDETTSSLNAGLAFIESTIGEDRLDPEGDVHKERLADALRSLKARIVDACAKVEVTA